MQRSAKFERLRTDLGRLGHRLARLTGSTWNWKAATAILVAVFVTGVETSDAAESPVGSVIEGVAEGVARTVEERVDETVAKGRGNERHLGFDTNVYPGDRTMRRWREVEHYSWVGYYLPAPCHKDPSWSGKRPVLEEQGWGLAVIYVGQQYWGAGGHVAGTVQQAAKVRAARAAAARRRPAARRAAKRAPAKRAPARKAPAKTTTKRRSNRAGFALGLPVPSVNTLAFVLAQVRPAALAAPQGKHTWDCKSELLSAAQGQREGLDAIARTEAEGFPRGTVIYLDIERMERIPQGMRDYYKAWTQAVLADKRYVPGYYLHKHNARQIHDDVKPLFEAAGATEAPRFWVASGRNFHKGKAPTDVGHEFAAIWQGVLDITETWGGVKLPIDINVSDTPNPSAPAD